MEGEKAGPEVDVAFFNALQGVFEKYPDAARKYAIRWVHDEIVGQKVDFDTQHAVSRVEGNKIVTQFENVADFRPTGRPHACCEWYKFGARWKCVRQCVE